MHKILPLGLNVKPTPHIDQLIEAAPSHLAKSLFENFAAAFVDPALNSADFALLLKDKMEKHLTENFENNAATAADNP